MNDYTKKALEEFDERFPMSERIHKDDDMYGLSVKKDILICNGIKLKAFLQQKLEEQAEEIKKNKEKCKSCGGTNLKKKRRNDLGRGGGMLTTCEDCEDYTFIDDY